MRGQSSGSSICFAIQGRDGAIVAHAVIDRRAVGLLRHSWSLHRSRDGVYAKRTRWLDGRRQSFFLHRAVLGLEPDDPRRVDHINGDTLDNRRVNLRIATVAENAQNQGSRGGSSSYRGVTWDKSRGKWMATAMLDGRRKTIGRFEFEADAAQAAAEWRALYMPFSAEAA